MVKYLLSFLFFIHGIIHLIGFAKAFNLTNLDNQLKLSISKPVGMLWLVNGLLFFYVAFLYLMQNKDWFYFAFIGILLSQLLVFAFWSDAKSASLVNLFIGSLALVAYANMSFENDYKQDVRNTLNQKVLVEELVYSADLDHLPMPVKRYLEYVGVVGKPKVNNVRVHFDGMMRRKEGRWFSFTSEQHNFFDDPVRLFFMKSRINGLPTYGYHLYEKEKASMKIRLMSLFDVISIENEELFKAETVTFFNDICVLAPAGLIDRSIEWRTINDTSAEALYSNKGVSITATLHFNEKGQLVNFISDDRYEISDMKHYRFSTPLGAFKDINGYKLPSYGEAVWHYPEGDFVYGKFFIQNIDYNVQELSKDNS